MTETNIRIEHDYSAGEITVFCGEPDDQTGLLGTLCEHGGEFTVIDTEGTEIGEVGDVDEGIQLLIDRLSEPYIVSIDGDVVTSMAGGRVLSGVCDTDAVEVGSVTAVPTSPALWQAWDRDGDLVGVFPSVDAAARALS